MNKVIAIAAMSVDGKIALNENHPSDWTSKEDKQFLRSILAGESLIVVGNNTYKASRAALSTRNCLVFSRNVEKVKKVSPKLTYCNPQNEQGLVRLLENYPRVIVLGGAQIYAYFLEHNMLDELYLTIEPVVFGVGLSLFGEAAGLEHKLDLVESRKLNDAGTLLLHYHCKSN